jgi:hypothetical protein
MAKLTFANAKKVLAKAHEFLGKQGMTESN